VHESPCVPRAVLASAARAFEAAQHGAPLPATPMDTFLRRELSERRVEATKASNPAETQNILVSGLETLAALPIVQKAHRDVPGADFMLEGKTKVAAVIRNEIDGRSLAPRLKKLLEVVPRKDGARSVILRDPRHPLSKNAVKTREHLGALREKGVTLVEPTVEALAALAALNDILADAASGDLANDGAPLSRGAVLDWLRTVHADLLLEPVQELVNALFSEESTEQSSDEENLAALLAEERALALEGAAERLGVPLARLLEVARKRSDRFLLLEGPPEIILDVAGVVSEMEG
jgi:hypothetical protein